jgi:HEAT repeat protein
MSQNLDNLLRQMDSPELKDRKLALSALRPIAPDLALPIIKKGLQDENQQVRSMAIFALGLKPTDETLDILLDLLKNEPDYGVRADAAGAIGYLEDLKAFEPLNQAFYDNTHWLVKFSIVVSLGNLKDPRAKKTLLQALNSEEVVIQQAAIAALGEIGAVDAVEKILTFITATDWLIRQRLAEALGNLDTEKSRSALRYLTKDDNPNVAEAAKLAIDRLLG